MIKKMAYLFFYLQNYSTFVADFPNIEREHRSLNTTSRM